MEDISNKRFNRLVAIKFIGKNNDDRDVWLFRCDCGKQKAIQYKSVKSGHTKSCGCLSIEITRKGNVSRKTHGDSYTRLYKIFRAMHFRCEHVTTRSKYYINKGIEVCQEWKGYTVFRSWALSNGYSDNLSIDRIDNSKGYSPENCRWATRTEQQQNRDVCISITYMGITKSVREWAEYLNINSNTLRNRFFHKWSIEKALTTPIKKWQKQITSV